LTIILIICPFLCCGNK